jgi:hypothetical protein
MTSISSFVPADYTVWAISGVCFVTALADALFVLTSSNCCSPGPRSAPSTSNGGSMSKSTTLWYPRLLMYTAMAFWGASLILPLNVLWGPSSVVAGTNVTNWTSQGWLCRIFITLALGITAPLACWLGLCILAVIMCRLKVTESLPPSGDGEIGRPPNMHCLGIDVGHVLQHSVIVSFLLVLPIAAAQSVIAWIGLTLQYNGGSLEESPTSSLGTFLAVFWYGNPTQCTASTSPTNEISTTNEYACTMCVFPAASVIVHGIWTLMFAAALVYVTHRLCISTLLSRKLKRTVVHFSLLMALGSIIGLVCMGTSIYYNNPFEWSHQGLWLGYVATILSSTVAICYIFDDFPKHVEAYVRNRPTQIGTGPLATPVFSPITPSQVMGAQRVQVFNPLDQVIQDRPLQDPSQAYRHIEEGLEDSPTTNRSTRATVP